MSLGIPRACSGAMYIGVPTGPSASIWEYLPEAGVVLVSFARPQSIT